MSGKTSMSVAELARHFKISKSTIYRMVHDKHIPYFDFRGTYRFYLEDVLNALKMNIGGNR